MGINLKDDDAGLAGNTFDDSIAIPITFVAEKEDGNIFSFIVLWGIIGGGGDNESGIGYSICPMERVRVVSKADEIKDDAETESVLSVVLCFWFSFGESGLFKNDFNFSVEHKRSSSLFGEVGFE